MSESSTPSVQFTKAEFTDPASAITTCVACQQPVTGQYFEVNGQTACPGCTQQIEQAQAADPGLRGFLAAIVAGTGAGVAGALLYYAVLALTGYEFGLIAVVVGFLVGRAVHWGASGRGGLKYQALAVALTYLSIVSCYVPFIVQGLRNRPPQQAAAGATAQPEAPPPAEAPPTAGQFAFALGIFAALVLASPFLAGFGNLIGWLIIGFALFEAWKINRRAEVMVTGPYEVAPAPTA